MGQGPVNGFTTRTNRSKLLALPAAMACLGLSLAACGSSPAEHLASPGSHKERASLSVAATSPFIYTLAPAWGTSWSFNPLSPTFLYETDDLSLLPLAVPKPTFGQYVPELASSWRAAKSKVTINLRADAKWQNGTAFTSKDVMDSLLIQGTDGDGIWDDITGASSPNAHQVVLDVKPGISSGLVLSDALNIFPMPASQYGGFLPAGLQKDLLEYFPASAKNPTAASKSPQGKTISAVFHRLESYAPKKLLGDGPFTLNAVTLQSIVLKKWSGFWDASRIHVPEVEWAGFATNEDAYGTFYTNQFDFSCTAMPAPIVTRFLRTSTNKLATPPNFAQFVLYYNDVRAPFNNVHVRQAIAYLINRKKVNSLAMAGKSPYAWVRRPDGIFETINKTWLPSSVYQSLNAYRTDTAKAASILRGQGFKKKGSTWYLPDGKPFRVSIYSPSGENDTDGMATAVNDELTAFGIKAKLSILQPASLSADESKGNFQLAVDIFGAGTSPLSWASYVIGRNLDFPNSGLYNGDKGIGFGPVLNVPGLGKVNVPETVSTEDATLSTGSKVKKLTAIWAKFINQQLPYLSLIDKNVQLQYSTAHYTDWPSSKNPLWTLMGENTVGGLMVTMQQGYIRPRA